VVDSVINYKGVIEANSIGNEERHDRAGAATSASKPVVRFRKADAARWQQIGLQF
jgi:hypothetical protein